MAERKNTGIAVPDAKRLNDCYHELSEAIAARPAMKGDRNLWSFDYELLSAEHTDPADYMHRCGSNDVALVALRGAVTNGNLQLWTYGPQGEGKVDRYALKEPTFATFKSGTYQPDNRLLDSAGLADCPLWVKEADWHAFVASLWAVRYGIDWNNPAPPADMPLMPPEAQFVTLSHALTWIAFGVSMGNDHLHEVLSQDRYGEHDSQEAIAAALEKLLASAGSERVAIRGKYRANRDDDAAKLDTALIEPIKFTDFRQFSYLEDELRHGHGLLFWHNGSGQIFHDVFGSGRKDSYAGVTVNRADLLHEFRPHGLIHSEADHFRAGDTVTRDNPAPPAPWWSVNQVLAWIATRQVDFVQWVGSRERQESAIGAMLTHFLFEQEVNSVQSGSLIEESWPGASALAQAGRLLLRKLECGEVTARVRGSAIPIENFVGIGLDDTGADWLDLNPQPLFSSAEVMQIFPAGGDATEPNVIQPVGRKGRTKGTGYSKADAPLLAKMEQAIANEPSLNATSAAKLFAGEAKGASFEAKADRLARAYRAGRNGE